MNEKQYLGGVSFGIKLKRALWNLANVLLFRPFVTKVFRLWRIALLKLFGAHVDWSAEVYASARIWAPWNLEMGPGSCIGPHVICYNQAKVVLRKDACLSQYAYVCTAGHNTGHGASAEGHEDSLPLNNAKTGLVVASVEICEGAWIGTRAFLNMGITVGEKAIVGACACVFKDVEPGTIVGGNPAARIK